MLVHYILAFFTGVLVKTVDWLDDDIKSKHPIKFVLAALYGLGIGYLISNASFAMLFLGVLVAMVFARKIDTLAHRLGFLVASLSLLFFGLPEIVIYLFVYFLLLGFLDEIDFIGRWRLLETYRPLLQIGSLALVLIGRWDFFFSIIAFDIGYLTISFHGKRFQKHKKIKKKR
ncbi:hypothetical protein GF318_06130 [Candidatus Micrarchaeota archaeon]|nr:hypothetical protein [Candidatus Micrarchaeota archaeon]